ncbi:hypothetical protein BDFB_013728 [Asbolus verrucosus]|uniref:Uncharacterized protein n=1 Tax=Asbolus verrucosus TaxID=1661398 RepID=A0A482W384_ASBVE|nr:hypothetical protein BDFB_013728 [Asbolus verrucosus]
MFVSAGLELKVHSCCEESVESHSMQHAPSQSLITDVSLSNDNSYIAVLRENEKPQILSAKDKANVRLIHTINVSDISAIAFKHSTKKCIAMGSRNGDVMMYDTQAKSVSNVHPKISNSIKALQFTCDDQKLCGLDGDVLFVFPDINSHNTLNKYKQRSECSLLKCHPFIPNRIAIGCKNGCVRFWDVQNAVELFSIDVFSSPLCGIAMSSCGNFLIACGRDLKICGIDFDNGACSFQFLLEQERTVTSVDLSQDDTFLAVGLKDGTLKLYDVKQHFKQVYCAKLHESSVNIIVFENKARELNSNFSSMIKLSEQEIAEHVEITDVWLNTNSTIKNKCVNMDTVEVSKEESLDKIKKRLMDVVKTNMNSLKYQFCQECVRLDKHFNSEFKTLMDAVQKKLFNFKSGDDDISSVKSKNIAE